MLEALMSGCRLMEYKNVLCIQPHPDDNEIAAGGTIAQLCHLGAKVTYLTVTDGRYGYSRLQDADLIVSVRRNEVIAAASLLGVQECRFLEYSDLGFADPRTMSTSIMEVIREVRPDVVLCADPWLHYEAHPDHIDAGLASIRASFMAQYPIGSGTPWSVQAVAMYYTAKPNTWVDCTHWMDKKLDAIRCHQSQFGGEDWETVRAYLYKHMLSNGKRIEAAYAEAFKVLPLLLLHAIPEAENM